MYVGLFTSGELPGMGYIKLKPVDTIRELYSFVEQEDLPSFSYYGKKTWLKLSECLVEYGLPPLKLPQEWIQPP